MKTSIAYHGAVSLVRRQPSAQPVSSWRRAVKYRPRERRWSRQQTPQKRKPSSRSS